MPTSPRFTEPLPVPCHFCLRPSAALTRRIYGPVGHCYSHGMWPRMGCMRTLVGMIWSMPWYTTHFDPSFPLPVPVLHWRRRRWWWTLRCPRCWAGSPSTPARMSGKSINATTISSPRRTSSTPCPTLTCMSGRPSRLGFRTWPR